MNQKNQYINLDELNPSEKKLFEQVLQTNQRGATSYRKHNLNVRFALRRGKPGFLNFLREFFIGDFVLDQKSGYIRIPITE